MLPAAAYRVVLITALAACAGPSLRQARWVPMPGNPAPAYPDALRDSGLAGEVVVEMRVDQTGVVDPTSLAVISETHPAFTTEVRRVIPMWRFQWKSGDSSEAVIQQRFAFKLRSPTVAECRAQRAREQELGVTPRDLRVLQSRLPSRAGTVRTVAEFVVDTTGRADLTTLRVVESSLAPRDALAQLQRVLPDWRFDPASKGGCVYASQTRREFVY